MADCTWSHRPIVEQHIVGNTIFAAQKHVPDFHVQISVVANDRRLTCSFSPLVPGAATLGGDERVDLNAPDHATALVVQGVMVHVPRYEHAITFSYRILLSVTDQQSRSLYNIDLLLPGVEVVRTGLAGIND
jgi:hypothetical protein